MSQLNPSERLVETLQCTAATIQRQEHALNEKQAAAQRYNEGIPAVVEQCVRYGRIDDTADEREKLAQWLSTPEGALEVIIKIAEQQTEPEAPAVLGQQVDASGRPAGQTKKASFADAPGGYLGRRTAEEPESWRRLTAGLGLANVG